MKRWRTCADNQGMITLAAIAIPVAAALGLLYGPEDRPGFNERKPLN
jgi:hypothetical protein